MLNWKGYTGQWMGLMGPINHVHPVKIVRDSRAEDYEDKDARCLQYAPNGLECS